MYAWGRGPMVGSRQRREGRWRAQAFYAGLIALVVAIEPPLDELADKLFWAHMLQHMLLQMVAPPLLVLGAPWLPFWRVIPLAGRRRSGRWLVHSRGASPLRLAARILGHPAVTWVLFLGTIALSHLPRVFDFALRDTAFHEGEHARSSSASACCSGLARSIRRRFARASSRREPLSSSWPRSSRSRCSRCVIMGTRSPLYAPYAALRPRPEGLSALADQQFGGALMLEPASLSLLFAFLWSIKRWTGRVRRDHRTASGSLTGPPAERLWRGKQ